MGKFANRHSGHQIRKELPFKLKFYLKLNWGKQAGEEASGGLKAPASAHHLWRGGPGELANKKMMKNINTSGEGEPGEL